MENTNYNRMYGSGQGAVPNSWQTIPKPHNLNGEYKLTLYNTIDDSTQAIR